MTHKMNVLQLSRYTRGIVVSLYLCVKVFLGPQMRDVELR